MNDRFRMNLLALLLVLVCFGIGFVALSFLYRVSLDQQREALQMLVDNQVRCLSTMQLWEDRSHHVIHRDHGLPPDVHPMDERILSLVATTQDTRRPFGESGEFLMVRKTPEGEVILHPPRLLPPGTDLADLVVGEPMRWALGGQSGTGIGLDYRGVEVLASFAYLPELNLGIVAKLDLEEVRGPVFRAAVQAAGIGLLIAFAGLWGIRRIGGELLEEKADLEEMVGGLLRHGEVGVYSRSREGRFTHANERFRSWVGGGELVGREALETLPDAFGRREQVAFEHVMRSGEAQVSIETLSREGQERVLLMQRFPLRRGEDGCQGVTTLATDISQEQRAARELEELGQQFQQLLANLRGGYWLRRVPSMELVECTEECSQLWGLESERLEEDPRAWLEVVEPRDRPRVQEDFEENAVRGLYQAEYQVLHRDGTRRWLRETSFPLRGELGEITRVGGLLEDVTEHHELQEQLLHSQKLDALGRFAAGIAHDFNNHLAVILGEAEFLSESCEGDSTLSGQAGRILEAAERASRLTRQVLAFGRRQQVRPVRIDLGEAVESLEEFLARLVGEDVRLRVELPAEPTVAEVDPAELEQVIMNLATNARDAMPGGGALRISVEGVEVGAEERLLLPELRPGRYVLLEVEDSGQGIPEDALESLFEPFYTTKEEGRGTGLGLALIHKVAVQSGGTVAVESEIGKGATFRVYLPRQRGSQAMASTPGTSFPKGTASHPRLEETEAARRILLVEDEDMLREVAARTLERQGFDLVLAEDGESALELLATMERPPDLLFTDLVMPGISGGELAARALELGCRRVLFTSGYNPDPLDPQLLAQLEHDFLPKPYRPGELEDRIRRLLGGA